MGVIKNNIVPAGYSVSGVARQPKSIVRLQATTNGTITTSGTIFTHLFIPPDDMRNDDTSGSMLYRVGIVFDNRESDTFTITNVSVKWASMEGLNVVNSSYEFDVTLYDKTSYATMNADEVVCYAEDNRSESPSAFADTRINPMGVIQLTYSIASQVRDATVPIVAFLDFTCEKD